MKIGIGASVITPALSAPLAGYYYARSAEGIHDDLQAKCVVVDDGQSQIALVACDLIEMPGDVVRWSRGRIEKDFGIAPDHVLISATHCHTAPHLTPEYKDGLGERIVESVAKAVRRKQSARLFVATEQEPSLPHNRRYLMKDGRVVTNPGFLNPDVVRAVGPTDPRVSVVYAEDERGEPLFTWVNYAMHLDTVGGAWISADYPYYLSRVLAEAKGPEMLTIFTIGAAGDINHWDVSRPGPQRGHEAAQHIGERLATAVIKAYGHLEQIADSPLHAFRSTIRLPAQRHSASEVEEAARVLAVPPRSDVDFTLERVKAERIMAIEARRGEDFEAELQALAIGQVALVGIPGECFVELGLAIQKQSPFPYTFVITCADGHLDYIPTRAAFEQGGYEPTSSRLAPGAGEMIVDSVLQMLRK